MNQSTIHHYGCSSASSGSKDADPGSVLAFFRDQPRFPAPYSHRAGVNSQGEDNEDAGPSLSTTTAMSCTKVPASCSSVLVREQVGPGATQDQAILLQHLALGEEGGGGHWPTTSSAMFHRHRAPYCTYRQSCLLPSRRKSTGQVRQLCLEFVCRSLCMFGSART